MKSEPLVMCLTNSVATNFTANCLLAIGAKPVMVEELSEARELAAVADAILINLGTVTSSQAELQLAAAEIASERGIPWVLDPVGVQLLSFRRQLARQLVELRPSIIRGNHAEIRCLGATGIVTLSTGETDLADGEEIAGGVPMLQSVTATGCAQGGLCAAFLGRGHSPHDTVIAVSRLMKRAGERAYDRARLPGSFQIALIDSLWELNHD